MRSGEGRKHGCMPKAATLPLDVHSLSKLVDDDLSPLLSSRIHPEAAALLEARALGHRPSDGYIIRISAGQVDLPAAEVAAALCGHFSAEAGQAERALREHCRNGWKALAIALLIVAGLYAGAESLHALGEKRVYSVLSESLVIIAWVTLWIPVEALIFENLSQRRRLARLRALSRAQVNVVPGA